MRFTSKLSRLVSVLSVLLLFVFLCSFALSNLPVAKAESHSIGLQDQDGEKHDHGEQEHGEKHEHDDHDHDDNLEVELLAHELEAAEVESEAMQMEMMGELFEVVEDSRKTAFFAVMTVDDLMEEEQAVEFLNQCLQKVENPVVQRAIRMKLVELQTNIDNPDAARGHLKALILEKQ